MPSLNYTDPFGGRSNHSPGKQVSKSLISVEINGQRRDIPSGLNVRTLLDHLAIDSQRVAVEVNRTLIRKTDWEATPVSPNDQIEIVMFVGGGSR